MSSYTVKIKPQLYFTVTYADGSKDDFLAINEAFGMSELHSKNSGDTLIIDTPSPLTIALGDVMNTVEKVTVHKCSPNLWEKLSKELPLPPVPEPPPKSRQDFRAPPLFFGTRGFDIPESKDDD